MNQSITGNYSLLFICSPSLGILDTWLPVLSKINELRPDVQIHCIIPKHRTVTKIDPDNVLIRLSDDIFDFVICKTEDNKWVKLDNLREAAHLFRAGKMNRGMKQFLHRLPEGNLNRFTESAVNKLQRFLQRKRNRNHLFNLQSIQHCTKGILYDVYTEKKESVDEILNYFSGLPKFSMSHGLKVKNINTYQDQNTPLNENTIVYIQSENEVGFVRDRFGVPENHQRVVGVPRHEKQWIDTIVEKEKNSGVETGDEFIFVISRPHTTAYHPKSRMKKALQHIRRLAWTDLDKKIVVKLHPKERKTGIYEKVFGVENYGSRWVYSNMHPLVLGARCDFAIAFYSGVVVDMIAMNVPSIELMDLRGLPKFDNEDSLRDSNDEPVFEYRYNDLALGASDYESLKKEASKILSEREKVMSLLRKNYNKHYKTKPGVTTQIASEILSKTSIPSRTE
mgnify:CR=1 FL=1